MSDEQEQIYNIGKKSVAKAIDLFQTAKASLNRRNKKKHVKRTEKFDNKCDPFIINNKKNVVVASFAPSFVLTEMRMCAMRHDWFNLQQLFPLTLELSRERLTLVWRYAFMILLHSPMSSGAHLEEFLNTCVGCPNENIDRVLDQLLSLKNEENEESGR